MRTLLYSFPALLALSLAANAQNGKIAGTVVDRDSGEPLPAATVVIEGTTRGAATDVNGEYTILNVAPGTYALRASFVGYGDQVVEDVEVSTGFTSLVDFSLGAGIELEEVVVQGERLIRQDETSTTTVLTGEDIEALPVQSFQETLTLAAGVVDDGGTLHFRGGRSSEVAYVVDGVLVRDPLDGSVGGFDLSRQAVNELQVLSGGFNAEYGEAMSGVIVVNTPTGGDNYRGSVRLQTDGYSMEGLGKGGPTVGEERPFSNDWGTRRAELTVSGPLIKDKVTFFVTADRRDTDTYLNEFNGPERPAVFPYSDLVGLDYLRPIDEVVDAEGNPVDVAAIGLTEGTTISQSMIDQLAAAGVDVNDTKGAVSNYQKHHSQGLYSDRTRMTANLLFRPVQDIDLKLGYNLTRRDFKSYSHLYKFLPQYNAPQSRKVDLFTAKLTHRVSPRAFYEVRAAFHNNRYHNALYDEMLEAENPYRFARIFSPFAVPGAFNTEGLSDAEGGSNYDFRGFQVRNIRTDIPELMLLEGDLGKPYMLGRNLDIDGDGTVDYRGGDFNSADRLSQELLDRLNALSEEDLERLGLSKNQVPILSPPTDYFLQQSHTKELQLALNGTAQVNNRNLVKVGLEFRQFDIFDYTVFANTEWDPTTDPGDPTTLTRDPEDETYVSARPYQMAAFLQDKIEFQNLIVQLGLRFDLIDAAVSNLLGYGQGGLVRRGEATPVDADAHFNVSPRVGIAFPVTDRARLSFNYGQFYQFPTFERLYQSLRTATWIPGTGYQELDEFGFDLGFESFLGNPDLKPENTVAYQIDGEFLVSESMKVGVSLFYKDIYDYISVRRTVGDGGVAFWVLDNLDYANVRGFEIRAEKALTNILGFTASYTYSRAFGNADAYDARFDEWYNNSVLGLIAPRNALPLDWDQPHTLSFSASARYQGISASLLGVFGSGVPYTPTSERGRATGPKNSARQPWTGNVDLRLNYTFEMMGNSYVRPFVEITNLLDKRNIITVFSTTGSPDFTLDPGTQFEDAQRPYYFGPPRHVEVGVQIGI